MMKDKSTIQEKYSQWIDLRRQNPEKATEALVDLKEILASRKNEAGEVVKLQAMVDRQIASDWEAGRPAREKKLAKEAIALSYKRGKLKQEQAAVDTIRADRRRTAERLAVVGKKATLTITVPSLDNRKSHKEDVEAIKSLSRDALLAFGVQGTRQLIDSLEERLSKLDADAADQTTIVASREFPLPIVPGNEDALTFANDLVDVYGMKNCRGVVASLTFLLDQEKGRKFALKQR